MVKKFPLGWFSENSSFLVPTQKKRQKDKHREMTLNECSRSFQLFLITWRFSLAFCNQPKGVRRLLGILQNLMCVLIVIRL